MGVGRGSRGAVTPSGFSYKVLIKQRDLMVLFFGLVFSVALPPENFSADALACADE